MFRCYHCKKSAYLSFDDRLRWLRSRGRLLKEKNPDLQIVEELFRGLVDTIPCPHCGRQGGEIIADTEIDDEQWGEARKCQGCGVVIDPERLEILPDTFQCTACSRAGRTTMEDQREFCPRCGGEMRMVARGGGGLAGYTMRCTNCR
jgi:Zn finger protein HypA/HybF involved in hydrogenase expression